MRPTRREFAHVRPGSVTAWLIFLNVLVYVADRMLLRWLPTYDLQFAGRVLYSFKPIEFWGHFSYLTGIHYLQFWRLGTFQFLHANFEHLLFNMMALFFFGPMVERYLTPRQFLPFYLLSGIGGGAAYLLLLLMGFRIAAPWVPLIGASAGIFGILVAAARIAPNAVVLLLGAIPMRLRVLVWLFIAYALFQVLFRGSNAGGEAAHLGGAAVGFLLMRFPQVLERIAWLGKRAPPF